jgi:hypothetical protein
MSRRWGKHVRLARRRPPQAFSNMDEGAGAPDSHPARRGRHGVADDSIWLETVPTLY